MFATLGVPYYGKSSQWLCGFVVDVDEFGAGVSTGMGSGGGRAEHAVGVTLELFISMSALTVVVGGIASSLGVWRCGRYGYGGCGAVFSSGVRNLMCSVLVNHVTLSQYLFSKV